MTPSRPTTDGLDRATSVSPWTPSSTVETGRMACWSRRIASSRRVVATPTAYVVAPLPWITSYAACTTVSATSSRSARVSSGSAGVGHSRMGVGPMRAELHAGNSVSPCSPRMAACTDDAWTCARDASSHRRRDVSRRVPEPITRPAGRPVRRWATSVRTSTGLVTSTISASGACACTWVSRPRRISTLCTPRSRRVCPGFCLAPAVITTTSQSARTSGSAPPVIADAEVNGVPWARSRTSARTLGSSMS